MHFVIFSKSESGEEIILHIGTPIRLKSGKGFFKNNG